VDVDALVRGTSQEAVAIPGLGRELLEGMEFGNSPAFDTWLLIERRRLLGAAEAALHEAALDRLAAGEAAAAVGLAARLVELNPYDENFQELLVRSYAEAGDPEAANRQVSACLELFRAEHGRAPGAAVFRAAEARPPTPVPGAGAGGKQAVRARLEAGRSAINAGSFDPGVRSLARAAAGAKACGAHELEAESWLALGTALVHAARGRDEEGADALIRATSLAEERALGDLAAAAHRELAYVDILQALRALRPALGAGRRAGRLRRGAGRGRGHAGPGSRGHGRPRAGPRAPAAFGRAGRTRRQSPAGCVLALVRRSLPLPARRAR
jgi:tetratricopeptide (TPR) repeat protein